MFTTHIHVHVRIIGELHFCIIVRKYKFWS